MVNAAETPRAQAPLASPTRIVLIVAGLVIIIAGLRAAREIVVPFLLAVFISILCTPALTWLRRRKVPVYLSVCLVVAVLGLAGFVTARIIGSSGSESDDGATPSASTVEPLDESHGRAFDEWVVSFLERRLHASLVPSREQIGEFLGWGGKGMGIVRGLLADLGSVLTNAFLIALTVIFILAEAWSFPSKLRLTLADPDASFQRLAEFMGKVNRYMAIKTLLSLATGILVAVFLRMIGVPGAELLGFLAFALNFIPSLGSILAAVPAVLLAFDNEQLGWPWAIGVAVGYAVINVVIGNLIEPRLLGRGVNLSTLVVFLSMLFWGWVLGPVGMLLSVPLTILVKLALQTHPDTRWLALWLGSASTLPPLRPPKTATASGSGEETGGEASA